MALLEAGMISVRGRVEAVLGKENREELDGCRPWNCQNMLKDSRCCKTANIHVISNKPWVSY